MKKYFILMSAALVALSCAKELADPQEATGNENITYKTITFESIATKTTLDGVTGDVAWEEGDQISIYYVDAEGKDAETVATAASAGETTTFSAQIPETENPEAYYAAYPKGAGRLTVAEATAETPASVSFAVYVAPTQCDGTFKDANYAAAYTLAGESMTLAFKNAVGIVKVPLPKGGVISNNGKDYKISGVYLRGIKGGDKNNGNVPVLISDEGTITGFGPAQGTSNINLSELSDDAIKTGYAYLPTAQCTWSTGLCVRYLSNEGTIPAVLGQEKQIIVERGHILQLPDLSAKVIFDYYVSPDGEGDGISADRPMNIAKMQEMITSTKDYMSFSFKLDGATFNLADGTYPIENTLIITTPSTGHKFTIKGNMGKAIFDGGTVSTGSGDTRAEVTTEGKQIFIVNTGTKVVFDGVTFQNGYAANGGAFDVNYTAKTTDADSSLEFHNCKFLRNMSDKAGGAILIRNAAAGGVVKFNQCYFKDNQTLTGGEGGFLYGNGAKAVVMFNKCTFHKNKSRTGGLEIHLNNAGARLGMNNCTINGYNYKSTVDKGVMANGSLVTNKGYSIIVNSTLWNSQYNGDWGTFALGSAIGNNAQNGAKLINSVFRNAKTQNGIYVAGNYHLNVKYCIYTGLKEGLNSPVSGTTYFVSDSYDLGLAGAVDGATGIDKSAEAESPYIAYSWNWVEGYPCPTLDQVRDEINNTAEIGPMFLAWLDTLEGSLTTDLAGNARNANAMCPGSYQQADTPVPAN